jgi:serine/threonine protein kinase
MPPGPDHIGPYQITGKIGSGGMATVYRALDPADQRPVAVKVLAVHLADDEEVRKRFEREANALRQLHHPHILPVFDLGHANGTPYIVMQLMSGRTLHDRLQGEPLPVEEVGRYTRQIASALDYAHARGIVHRDVKPANILLDDAGSPYLADFGVAYWTAGSDSGARLTQTGAFVGTAAYASPEQLKGQQPGRPSDIYSLAVLVFEMATGRLPFEASSSLAVIKMHLRDAPPNPLAYNPRLPLALYHVLVKALAKMPGARYPSAMQFSDAVDAALSLNAPPQPGDEDDWLYGDIQPVVPDVSPDVWVTPTPAPAGPGPTLASAAPALTDPFGFDAQADYGGPDDPFADIESEDVALDEVVAHFSAAAFDDQFDLGFAGHNADFPDDFADEVGIEPDEFPLPSLVLNSAARPAQPSPVIRPLHPPPSPPPAAPPDQPEPRAESSRLVVYGASLLALIALIAALMIAYGLLRGDSSPDLTAPYRSDVLGITFQFPDRWYAIPEDAAVLSSTPAPTVLLADRPVSVEDGYSGAPVVVAVQHIDPVDVFGIPAGCESRVFDGPALTFACLSQRGFTTPVYQPFDAASYPGSVRLPGTLPPARASLPTILLPTGQAQWIALIIVHWESYDGAQNLLMRIARSVRPIQPE